MNKFILASMVWLSVAVTGHSQTKNDQYCNARFGFCVDYPVGTLVPQEEAANGDGRKFTNKNGEAVLTVFGRLNLDAEGNAIPLARQYGNDVAELQKKGTITYKKATADFYVISGQYKNGKIFYHKVIKKEDAFCYAMLEYSKDENKIYDAYAGVVLKSFK